MFGGMDLNDIPEEDRHPLGGLRCKAMSKRTRKRCEKKAMLGQTVCRTHGGGAKQSMAKAEVKMMAVEADKAVVRFGLPVDVSPSEALLDEVRWTAGHVQYLRNKVQELDEDMLTFGIQRVVTDEKGKMERTLVAQVNVWYNLYLQERKHLVEVSKAAIMSGVEQRKIELAEQQGQMVAAVVRRVLDSMLQELLTRGLDVEDYWDSLTQVIVPREFRALEVQ